MDNNDDNSLCRYEFSEIIARIGKEKYFDNGLTRSVAEGTKRAIEEHIIPNTCEKMPWQGFRDKRLWILEVNDVFTTNLKAVDALYNFAMTGPHTKDVKTLSLLDTCYIIKNAGAGWESEEFNRKTGLAYSLSKMTIIDDMEDFEKYDHMLKVEFYEFLGRLAELLFENEKDEEVPLYKKLARLLTILL